MATCQALKTLNPAAASGVYDLRPRGPTRGLIVPAFCDMSQTPAGQSLFDIPGGAAPRLEGSSICTLNRGNDDMDSTYMWADLTGKVCTDQSTNFVGSNNWMTLERSGVTASATVSPRAKIWTTADGTNLYRPPAAGSNDKPIPFPGSGVPGGTVVWLSSTSIRFRVEGVDYALNYPAEIPTSCRPSTSTNQNIFVTDGISSVTIGRKATGSTSVPTCMNVLSFDWSASSYTQAMLSVVAVTSSSIALNPLSGSWNWHTTEEDVMGGDLLWTVRGKPCWYGNYGSGGRLRLGTSMTRPFEETQSGDVFTPSATASYSSQTGADVFIRVDTDGVLWIGDWGHDNGGIFACSSDSQLGIRPTNVRLAITPPSPPPPPPVLSPPSALPAPPPMLPVAPPPAPMNASQLWNATAAEQKFVVTTSIVCEGCDEASFDWASFKSHLATFLLAVAKIDESDIFLTYTAGSDEVGLRVVAHSQPDAVQVANRFQEARANPGELEAAIGVSVISIAPPQVEDSMVMVTEDGQLLKGACATRLSRSCAGALYESVVGYVPFPVLVVVSIFGGMLIGWFFCSACFCWFFCCRRGSNNADRTSGCSCRLCCCSTHRLGLRRKSSIPPPPDAANWAAVGFGGFNSTQTYGGATVNIGGADEKEYI